VLLCTRQYEPDWELHRYLSDVTHQVTGAGYKRGGARLTGKTVTTAKTGMLVWDAADTEWLRSTVAADQAVVYKDTGDPATSPLLACMWFPPGSSRGSGFTVHWSSAGIMRVPHPGQIDFTSTWVSVTDADGVVYEGDGIEIREDDILTVEREHGRVTACVDRGGDHQTHTLRRQEPKEN
jgi:hypothetical protein